MTAFDEGVGGFSERTHLPEVDEPHPLVLQNYELGRSLVQGRASVSPLTPSLQYFSICVGGAISELCALTSLYSVVQTVREAKCKETGGAFAIKAIVSPIFIVCSMALSA